MSEYGKINLGDKVSFSPRKSRHGFPILKTTIIKPDGKIYEECCHCGYYFLCDKRIKLLENQVCLKCKEK